MAKTKINIKTAEPVKAAQQIEQLDDDLAVEIVKYLQANFFRNDNRKMKIETKADALEWLKSQK